MCRFVAEKKHNFCETLRTIYTSFFAFGCVYTTYDKISSVQYAFRGVCHQRLSQWRDGVGQGGEGGGGRGEGGGGEGGEGDGRKARGDTYNKAVDDSKTFPVYIYILYYSTIQKYKVEEQLCLSSRSIY